MAVLSSLVLLFGPTFLAYFFPENVRSEIEVNLGGVAGLVDGGSGGLRDFSDVINAAASDAADKWSIGNSGNQTNTDGQDQAASGDGDANSQLPAFPDHGDADYIIVNDNIPYFTENELLYTKGQSFSELDVLGRCGPAIACLDRSMMPSEERGEIGQIKPTGWHTVKYPGIISDRYLYNRSHLIAYAMTGVNDDPRNLITGTRYMNSVTMLEFEIKVLEYLDRSDGHVLYRVTPYFKDNELVARGVEMEAMSVEDRGASLMFHVFVYNYQPGIEINYSDGSSRAVMNN